MSLKFQAILSTEDTDYAMMVLVAFNLSKPEGGDRKTLTYTEAHAVVKGNLGIKEYPDGKIMFWIKEVKGRKLNLFVQYDKKRQWCYIAYPWLGHSRDDTEKLFLGIGWYEEEAALAADRFEVKRKLMKHPRKEI